MQLQNIQITGGLTFIPEILTPSGDPYWANVSLLMNTTSTNNQNNNTFLDGSTNNFTVTRVGTPTQGSFTPFALAPSTSYSTSVNGGSGYFTTGNYLSVPDNAVLQLGSSNFTIEFWMKTASNNAVIISKDSDTNVNYGSLAIATTVAGKLEFYCNPQAGSLANRVTLTSTTTVSNDQWHHIAIVRNGNNWNLYVNGVSEASATSAVGFWSAANPLYISATLVSSSPSATYIGSLSSLRIVKGTAVYTSAFTPPTSPLTAIANTSLLLNFTNAGMYDAATKNNLTGLGDTKVSTAQAKFAPTSVAFDGTGDYLTAPNNTALQMGTSDFTIEFWIYYNNITGFQTPFDKGYSGVGGLVFQTGNGTGRLLIIVGGTVVITEAGTGSSGTWIHYALVRSGTALTLYRDGVSVGTATNSTNLNNTSQLALGANGTALGGGPGNYLLNGYIQDLRVTKGVARYTETFTPPTEPFPTN